MTCIFDVRLELVRPGPPHNQLLSPLTSYMALCGDGSPITFHINYEHRQLLNRLERLRYIAPDGQRGYAAVPEQLREAQVRELGEEMGQILAMIPSLNAELSRERRDSSVMSGANYVHLRIVLSGSELSVLPFELARAPQSFPGEGLDLSLQDSLPVVVTREIRRSRPLPVTWGVPEPKVLFVYAEPEGMTVPKVEHLHALRAAVEPWVEWPEEEIGCSTQEMQEQRLPLLKKHLRVVPNASIKAIQKICAEENFTHVHILAHGDHYFYAGEQRFGLALCKHDSPKKKEVVDGEQIAKALRVEKEDGSGRSQPLLVTMATCDSGQQGSVLVPGGSIAHDLHTEGIPWVVASQFPLTKRGSVLMVDFLYSNILRGDDPRQVLYELRRKLSMASSRDHDWASIVAYASIEDNLEHQVARFFQKQTVRAIEVKMGRADRLVEILRSRRASRLTKEIKEQIEQEILEALKDVRKLLSRWEQRIPTGSSLEERKSRAYWFGMKGSTLKRIGIMYASLDDQSKATSELSDALDSYRNAMEQWVTEEARFNWTASQYLALSAVLEAEKDPDTCAVCRKLAARDLESSDRKLQAWAHATLAELKLIGLFHETDEQQDDLESDIIEHCRHIIDLTGPDSFNVHSTRRQFQRYAERWRLGKSFQYPPMWKKIAEAAVDTLTP